MAKAPIFFVPMETPDTQEAKYVDLARFCERPVPGPDKRIYSLVFTHDREEWTATVGEPLRGIHRRSLKSRGRGIGRETVTRLSDPAIVLAIFGNRVVTNHGLPKKVGSRWENPFFVGGRTTITYFSSGD